MSRTPKSDSPLRPAESRSQQLQAQPGTSSPRRYVYALSGCVAVAISVGAYLLRAEYREQVNYWQERLTRTAEVNRRLLENWVEEREEDVQLLASLRSVQLAALGRRESGTGRQQAWEQQLQVELATIAGTYAGAFIVDRRGEVLAASEHSFARPAEVAKACAGGCKQKVITIPPPGGRAGYPQLAFIYPIHPPEAGDGKPNSAVIGYAVVLTRAEAIPSLLLGDATGMTTGESLFVTSAGNQPIYVSPLRHWNGIRPAPPPPPGSPAQKVLLDRRGSFGEFRDYRGDLVLAATQFIPELGWGIVIKVDREEAGAEFQQKLILAVCIVLLLIVAAVGMAAAWRRQQRIQRLQTDLVREKKNEEDLRQSEERFWLALQHSPVVVFNQDRQLRYTWIHNPQPPWSDQDYHDKTDEELIGVADGSRLSALKLPVIESGMGVRKEWSFVYRGEKSHYDISIQPLRDNHGNIMGITCACTDITQRKRIEEQLRESERKYRRLFETTEALGRTDMAGKFLEVNPAYQHLLGYSAEELTRLTYQDVTPEQWHAVQAEIIQNQVLTRGYSDLYEKKYRRKDGTVFPVELRTFLIRDENNQARGLWAVVRDITERKQAERALRDSEAQLRVFVNQAPYGIFRCRNDRFLSANPALVRLLGYDSEAAVLGLKISTDVSLQGTGCCEFGEGSKQGHFGPLEVKWTRRDRSTVLVRVSGRISSGSEDGQEVVEGIAEDVTQQHIVEEHLRQSDRMEALGRLASGVAHDFNNILLGITLNLEHAIARIEATDNLLREELEQALQAAQSAASVTQQLLVFGRRRSLQLQHISLNEVVARSQNLVKQMAGEKIHVRVVLGAQLGKVRADPVEIQQVILNLAVNARDAMPEGGQIAIKTANLELKEAPADEYFLASPLAGNYVVLEMSDTGSGIAKDTLSHVFEPFFTTKEEGSGLGLSTSYGIVAQSGGYMSIRTELGRGTTFRAYLPRATDLLPHAAEGTEAPASLFTSCEHTVLVVDDAEVVRNAISRDLQQHGYFVLSACNSSDALRMSRRHSGAIDLLLTDIVMPGMDGRELARLLLNERPFLKVIYISGDDRAASGGDAANEFRQPLLYKPFTSQELVCAVANVLQAKTA